jgi:hypothetical protein
MFRRPKTGGFATSYWSALFKACGILILIATLSTSSAEKVNVERAQVFFSKTGTSLHTLHYSNIKQDFDLRGLCETLEKVRTAVRTKASSLTFVQLLHNNKTRTCTDVMSALSLS